MPAHCRSRNTSAPRISFSFKLRNRVQQLPRRRANLLAMSQMAGVLIRHGDRHIAKVAIEFDRRQELVAILHQGLESRGFSVIGGVVFEQLIVFLQRRSHSRRCW